MQDGLIGAAGELRECAGCGLRVPPADSYLMPLGASKRTERKPYCRRCAESRGLPDLSKCGKCKTPLSNRSVRCIIGDSCYCWECGEDKARKQKPGGY